MKSEIVYFVFSISGVGSLLSSASSYNVLKKSASVTSTLSYLATAPFVMSLYARAPILKSSLFPVIFPGSLVHKVPVHIAIGCELAVAYASSQLYRSSHRSLLLLA